MRNCDFVGNVLRNGEVHSLECFSRVVSEVEMVHQNCHKNGHSIQTSGEIFSDKTAIELIRDPANPESLKLVRCRQGLVELKPEVAHADRMYEPLRLNRNLSSCVRFPTRIGPPESAEQLFKTVHCLLTTHLGQPDSCVTAMVCGIFSSWFWPVLPMAPILWILAPAGSPKNLAMRLLALLCRRPLRLVGVRRGDLLRAPMPVQPTLLLDEPDLKPPMPTILEASSYRGAHIPSSHGMLELFGPKVIFSRTTPSGTPLETDALRTALVPVSRHLPLLDAKAEEAIAEEFQARFLGCFLRNFDRLQTPKFYGGEFTLPMQNLASAFCPVFDDDEELRARILGLLSVQDEEVRTANASAFASVVLEAVLFFIHKGGCSKVRTQEIADKVTKIYKGRGLDQKNVSAESVGWGIKRLGIPSGRIDKAGNGVELSAQVCRQVHQLGLSYAIRAMHEFRSSCRYCKEQEAAIGQTKTDDADRIA